MAGTEAGGKKAAKKNLANDPLYYVKLGKRAAAARKTHYEHFTKLSEENPEELAQLASIGGKKSKRKPREES